MSSSDDFFSGGNPSAKFEVQGKVVGGRITRVGDPMQQRDMKGEPKFWDAEKREPMMQLPIDIQTDERDPEIIGDDGTRTLYVKGDMKRAVTEALRKAGAKGAPRVGGTLEVAWTGTESASQRGFNDKKLYTARYTAPGGGDAFFGTPPAGSPAVPAQPVDPFASQAPAAQPVTPPATPAQGVNPFGDEPPF